MVVLMADFVIGTSDAIQAGILVALQRLVEALPYVLLSLVIVFVGYVASVIVSNFVGHLLDRIKLEEVFKKFKVEDALGGMNISHVLVKLLRWTLIMLVLMFALSVLPLPEVTVLFQAALALVPKVFIVVLLMLGAAVLGEWAREVIMEFNKFPMQRSLANIVKFAIVFTGAVIALQNADVKLDFLTKLVEIVMQGVMIGIALAFGLAFGLGGQKDAQDIIKKFRKKLDF